MKISLENFGPIREFSIDLEKDFHLLVGQNNVGKSYAMTALYLIVKTMLDFNSRGFYWAEHSHVYTNLFEKALSVETQRGISQALNDAGGGDTDFAPFVKDGLAAVLGKIFSGTLSSSFISTFSSLSNLDNKFSEEKFRILIDADIGSFAITRSGDDFCVESVTFKTPIVARRVKVRRSPSFIGGKLVIYYCEKFKIEDACRDAIMLLCLMFFSKISELVQSVHYLPASRSGLYQALSAFGQIIAELSRNRSFLSRRIELPGISEPVSDYFIKLSEIRVVKKLIEGSRYNFIAKKMEKEILRGRIDFNPQSKQLLYFPEGSDLRLELSSVSSMVSELAPIVSYLRYVLTAPPSRYSYSRKKGAKHLIMIEEPEAHLHPEIQIKLTEIFADLIAADVKIVITSHSNFVFNKVNNLIMAGVIEPVSVGARTFKNTAAGAVALDVDINEFGMSDENFSLSTRELLDEKIDILEKLNSESLHD